MSVTQERFLNIFNKEGEAGFEPAQGLVLFKDKIPLTYPIP
jgi:hypothetical protein